MSIDLHDRLALAHAVFACLATLITLPIALLAGRYLRGSRSWYRVHIVFNTITVVLITMVFGLGMGAVATAGAGTQFSGPGSDLHHQIGLAVFLIVLLQAILGAVTHNTRPTHPIRRVHVPLGIVTAAGLYWVTWEGMHNEWAEMSDMMTVTPEAVQILFWVFFLVAVTAYTLAAGQATLSKVSAQLSTAVPSDVKYEGQKGSLE